MRAIFPLHQLGTLFVYTCFLLSHYGSFAIQCSPGRSIHLACSVLVDRIHGFHISGAMAIDRTLLLFDSVITHFHIVIIHRFSRRHVCLLPITESYSLNYAIPVLSLRVSSGRGLSVAMPTMRYSCLAASLEKVQRRLWHHYRIVSI